MLTLLTFWPPGPPLRAKLNLNSRSGMRRCGVTMSMIGRFARSSMTGWVPLAPPVLASSQHWQSQWHASTSG